MIEWSQFKYIIRLIWRIDWLIDSCLLYTSDAADE